MKKIFTVFLFITSFLTVFAQTNYEEIFDAIPKMKDYEAYQMLFDYHKQTTSKTSVNVNCYYQMGVIMQKMMRQYDPFVKMETTQYCINNAKLYLSLCSHYFNENEARQNGRLYNALPQNKRQYADIKQDIATRIADVKEFEKYFKQANSALTNGIFKYSACLEFFDKINEKNERLNDLYFIADKELLMNLANLQLNFDSTKFYINKLQSTLEEYHLADYKISYSLTPIDVYRLNGVTSSNFLEKNFKLWDFADWVGEFNKILQGDVKFLHTQAEKVYTDNKQIINKLLMNNKSDLSADFMVNPMIINKMYKYDYNSLVALLLEEQESKIRFLYHKIDNVTSKNIFSALFFSKTNDYYSVLVDKKKELDQKLQIAQQKINAEGLKKYNDFFKKNFNNIDALKDTLTIENQRNQQLFHQAIDDYKNNVLNFGTADNTKILYKNENLYLSVTQSDKCLSNGYFVHSRVLLDNEKVAVSGTYLSENADKSAFVALFDKNKNVEWLKIIDKNSAQGLLISVANNGIAVIIRNLSGNKIQLYDFSGNMQKEFVLPAKSFPRKLIYNDVNQAFTVAFKGKTADNYEFSNDNLQILSLTSNLSLSWTKELAFNGFLSNIIFTNNIIYVYGAYTSLQNANNQTVNTKNNVTNAFVQTFDSFGNRNILKTFDEDFSYFPLFINKINNENTDIIAVKNSLNVSSEAFYMLLSEGIKTVFEFTK